MKRLSKMTAADTLAMAIGIEGANAAIYTIWADRFRPYNTELSELLDGFAQEEKLSQKKLKELYKQNFHKTLNVKSEPTQDDALETANEDLEHFFVLNESMSKKIINAVMKAEYDTLHFFQNAQLNTKDKNMEKTFHMLADFEKQHVNELKENLEHNQEIKPDVTEDPIKEDTAEWGEQKLFATAFNSDLWRNEPNT